MTTSSPFITSAQHADLVDRAHAILTADLHGHGTTLSRLHASELRDLLATMAGYLLPEGTEGAERGRLAYPMATGLGKTSSVVALLAAMHEQGITSPVAVLVSRVDSMVSMHKALCAHGVPAELIALKHSDAPGVRQVDSTGAADRRYALMSHARVTHKQSKDFAIYAEHEGQPRPLVIHDESLLTGEGLSFEIRDLFYGYRRMGDVIEEAGFTELAPMHEHLMACHALMKAKLDAWDTLDSDEQVRGVPIVLPKPTDAELAAWLPLLRGATRLRGHAPFIKEFLEAVQPKKAMHICNARGAGGVLTVRTSVPEGLANILALDASVNIRKLKLLDKGIRVAKVRDDVKDWSPVALTQVTASGSRYSIQGGGGDAKAVGKECRLAVKETMEYVRSALAAEPQRPLLFICFMQQLENGPDCTAEMKHALAGAGLKLDAVTSDGKPQFMFEKWGAHDSSNEYAHAKTVYLVGVLHRSHIDLTAAAKAQLRDIAADASHDFIEELVQSECVSAIFQGLSRGACRVMDNGKAKPMDCVLIHKSDMLETALRKVMPGYVHQNADPVHMVLAKPQNVTTKCLALIVDYLRDLDPTTSTTPTDRIKAALGIVPGDKAGGLVFRRAIAKLDPKRHGWGRDGTSHALARLTASAYGFPA